MESSSNLSDKHRKLLLIGIALLYLLALDWWNWSDATRIFGLPRFFLYLIVVQLLLTIAFYILARYFWPDVDDDTDGSGEPN